MLIYNLQQFERNEIYNCNFSVEEVNLNTDKDDKGSD